MTDAFVPQTKCDFEALTTSEKEYIISFGPPCLIELDDRVDGTCTWSTETPEFMSWKNQDEPAILWLTGNAGCGKTILTNFLVQHLVHQEQRHLDNYSSALVCSFFCARDRKAQHDVHSLLRDLIRQLLISSKEIIHELKALFGSTRHEYDPSFETLWRIFERLIQMVPRQCIYIAIDALDECEERSKRRLLSNFTSTMIAMSEPSTPSRKRVKIIISGQAYVSGIGPSVAKIDQYHLDIDPKSDKVSHDISRFIDLKVDDLISESICSESAGMDLKRKLKSMSENSFLWLRVVIDHIQQSLSYEEADLEQMLAEVPRDLQDAYAKYLPTLALSQLPVLQKYLKLLIACARPLTLVEVDCFANVDGGIRASPNDNVTMSSVKRALGPLVKFSNGSVQMIHSTAKEFFVSLSTQKQHPNHVSHGIELASAHLFCATSCMKYLTAQAVLEVFERSVLGPESYTASPITPRHTGFDEDVGTVLTDLFDVEDVDFLKDEDVKNAEMMSSVKERLGGYEYAARNWAYHFAQSERVADDATVDAAIELLRGTSDPLRHWYKYAAHSSRLDMPAVQELDAVVLAALFDHRRSLRTLLTRAVYEPTSLQLRRALFWAAARGHCGTLTTLLNYGVPPSAEVSGSTPLTVAIRGGFIDACRLILETQKAGVNSPDRESKPPIVLAAAFNHGQILKLLLLQSSVQVDARDFGGRTALSHASAHNSDECLDILILDGRADLNLMDSDGCTALHLASQCGNDHAVKRLLASPRTRTDVFTAAGRNPLSLAAQHGHLAVVRRLCHRGLSAAHQDAQGRNAISWACNSMKGSRSNGAESVLQYLVRKFPEAADAPDVNGWTPLAWTMDPPGYLDAARTLLNTRSVDVNRTDSTHGRTALAWAASQGFVDMVQLLLTIPGVEKNSLSHEGRSPISYAAANGMFDVVKLLLDDKEVTAGVTDSSGRKPINWAALNGNSAIVSLFGSQEATGI